MEREDVGLLYRKQDYLGFFARLFIDLIDVCVLAAGCVLSLYIAVCYGYEENDLVLDRIMFAWLLVAFIYIGPFKATPLPTLGYLIFRAKLVNSRGNRAGFWQASGRAVMMVIGPLNFLLDLFWLFGDSPRQALRDKLSSTYLIRKNAEVVARGKIVRNILHVMGYRMQVEEIKV